MSEQPADPGWETTDDGCHARIELGRLGEEPVMSPRCELDPEHVQRGEPHTVTFAWFDPTPEPDCATCADTGQVQGQPCPENCARAKWLAGQETQERAGDILAALPNPGARWIQDDDQ